MVSYLPSGLLGVGLTALLAAFMSGMAGNVTAFNTVWTYDIYRSYFRPDASDRHYMNVGRIVTVVGTVLSAGTAYIVLQFASIMDYVQLLFSFFSAPLLAAVLFGMFWKRATPWAGFYGLVSGTAAAGLLYALEATGVLTFGSAMAGNFWRAWWAWLFTALVIAVVSFFTRPKPEGELEGLVWGMTDRKQAVEPTWYKKPWVLGSLAIAIVLNFVFF